MHIMILLSTDGPDYTHAILYPATWTRAHADTIAAACFAAVQAADPDEWSWEDYVPRLEAAGFVLPDEHDGPVWDCAYYETQEDESEQDRQAIRRYTGTDPNGN
jgi:hypothetical protein